MKSRPIVLVTFLSSISFMPACSGGSSATTPQTPELRMQLISMDPPSGAAGVDPDVQVRAMFSSPIDPASVNAASFTVFQGGNQLAGSVTSEGAQVRFTPKERLSSNASFRASVNRGLRGILGEELPTEFSWNFSVKDTVPPRVTNSFPYDGLQNVPKDAEIFVRFSEPMDEGSLRLAFSFVTSSGTAVPGQLQTSSDEILFTPAIPLEELANYILRVGGSARDAAGNALESSYVATFKTTETVPPFVVSFTPEDGSREIRRDSIVIVKFSETLSPDSINEAGIYLKSEAGAAVDASLVYDNQAFTVSLVTKTALEPLTHYIVTVTRRLRDVAGNGLAEEMNSSFTTRERTCGTPEKLREDENTPPFNGINLAGDNAGNAFAAYYKKGSTAQGVYVKRYLVGSGWEPEVNLIPGETVQDLTLPQIALYPDKKGFIAWMHKANNRRYLKVARYDGVWNTPVILGDVSIDVKGFSIAADSAGNAIVVFNQPNAADRVRILATRFSVATQSWSTPLSLEANTDPAQGFPNIQLGMDSEGNALVVWPETMIVNGRTDLYYQRYKAGSDSWNAEGPALVEQDDATSSQNPQLAMNAAGEAFLIWERSATGTKTVLSLAHFTPNAGFDPELAIFQGSNTNTLSGRVAADNLGNAFVVWRDGGRVYSEQFIQSEGGWQAEPTAIETRPGDPQNPWITVDTASGRALAIWDQIYDRNGDSSYDKRTTSTRSDRIAIYGLRYDPGAQVPGWERQPCFLDMGEQDVLGPAAVLDPADNATMIFLIPLTVATLTGDVFWSQF